jgi:hypothetical protein
MLIDTLFRIRLLQKSPQTSSPSLSALKGASNTPQSPTIQRQRVPQGDYNPWTEVFPLGGKETETAERYMVDVMSGICILFTYLCGFLLVDSTVESFDHSFQSKNGIRRNL